MVRIASIRFCIPRLYAAASLKRSPARQLRGRRGRIPRLYAAASLKLRGVVGELLDAVAYSAALCRGLIEAPSPPRRGAPRAPRIPRLYAAASLKPGVVASLPGGQPGGIPRLYAAASLKLGEQSPAGRGIVSIPRLYAAASLKRIRHRTPGRWRGQYSAALCRGLIEARASAARSSAA